MKLKEIRIQKGLLQKDIAEILGVKQQAVSKYEDGSRKLNQEQIIKLSLSLEVTPDELLGFREAYENYTNYLKGLAKDKQKH